MMRLPTAQWGATLALLAALSAPGLAAAQDPPPPPPARDTIVAPDSAAAADTLPPPSAASAAADSVLQLLLDLPGYTPIRYKAQRAEFRTDSGGILKLESAAEIDRAGERLTAEDSIIYTERTKRVAGLRQPDGRGRGAAAGGRRAVL